LSETGNDFASSMVRYEFSMSVLPDVPLAKVVYTIALIGLIAFLARELYGLWFDNRLYVGDFQYFVDGKNDDTQGRSFPTHILGQHQLLRSALVEENIRRKQQSNLLAATPSADVYRGLPSSLPEITRWQLVLSDVELKVQGFDFGKLFTALRTWISPPKELRGFVEKAGTNLRATVNWPPRQVKGGSAVITPFETGYLAGDSSVALAVAASIVWLHAADADAAFAKIPRDVFVAWVLAWWDCRYLQGQKALKQTPSEDDKKKWKQARRLIETIIEKAATYPEIWKVRADIIDAAPDGTMADANEAKKEQELAKSDRKSYADAMGLAPVIALATALKLEPKGALEAAGKIVAADRTVQPSRQIWARREADKEPARVAITATAIVLARDGSARLLLPDFALLSSQADDFTEYRLSPDGPVVARAQRSDLVYPSNVSGAKNGLLLARVEGNAGRNNTIAGDVPRLEGVTALPPPGTDVTLFAVGRKHTTRVRSLDGMFAATERITGPGDAGAPLLDVSSRLMAMAHSSGPGLAESRFLSVNWIFEQEGLRLAP
jgi:hypothetical protein